ncbi:hypothetical protein [Capnocytophaga canis]|uniref:hypothetical protein n=1 Tax=Capnocytophaga canis TaxID=1848903 RepID=UPI001562B207|nr:hypothetical protein [Capnocytophaga canis]
MKCPYGISEDVIYDFCTPPSAGIERDILLINWDDIDRNATLFNETKTRIRKFRLKEGKRAYLFRGFKKLFKPSSKPIIDDLGNGFQHSINIRIFKSTEENLHQIYKAVSKGLFVAIVETKDKGDLGRLAYEVLGYDCGMQITSSEGKNYNDHNGAYLLSFLTPKNQKEPRPLYKWLEDDYSVTKHKFDKRLRTDPNDFQIFDRTFDKTFE